MKPAPDDRDFATALSTLHREVHALYGEIARKSGLSTPQAQLLCSLSHRTPSFGELAELLGCDKTNVTGMIDRLERRGLVTREKDPGDRRISRIVLTHEGESLCRDIRGAFARTVADRCGSLDRSARLIHATAQALSEGRSAG